MKSLTSAIITNAVIKVAYVVCVTFAAVYFNSAWLLCWYLLLLCIGYDYKSTKEKKKDE